MQSIIGGDSESSFDFQELLKRIIKYIFEGIAVAFAAFYIPAKKPDIQEVLKIGLTAAATFAILDMYAPSIGSAARQGAGFGIGAAQVGWPASIPM